MDQPLLLDLALWGIGSGLFLGMIYVGWISYRENEPRAAHLSILAAIFGSLPFFFLSGSDIPGRELLLVGSLLIGLIGAFIYLTPIKARWQLGNDTPRTPIDERDVMFSRRLLVAGTDRFHDYYQRHSDKKELDDRFRREPGLLQPGSRVYHLSTFAAANANFDTVAYFHYYLDQEPLTAKTKLDPAKTTRFIKKWMQSVGAVSVGVTKLEKYHIYSHIGRGAQYGQPVNLPHQFAIAMTVEMSKERLDSAPFGPAVMETAQQYLRSGTMAVQLAEWIRQLGYPARAHIDGNYRVVCPLVARDAGLGEIGRMGLLMTPELGPRVRIAVVTTDLPLVVDQRQPDITIIDFCRQCKKCAEACPSRAISFIDRTEIDGVKRWQINQEACYTYWTQVGTDCGRCVRVCPYSHPNNRLHNLIRWGVRNSALFRTLAIKMDDILYGRIPKPAPIPDWMDIEKRD